jgi:hypothetical protein
MPLESQNSMPARSRRRQSPGGDHHDQRADPLRGQIRREHPDHRADRVAHERRVAQVERLADLDDVPGVPLEGGVTVLRERGRFRAARTHVVEETTR